MAIGRVYVIQTRAEAWFKEKSRISMILKFLTKEKIIQQPIKKFCALS